MRSNITACSWLLKQPDNQQILINFTKFDLGTDCNKNYITIYNGKTQTAPKIGIFCANRFPRSIRSQGSHLLLQYNREENPVGQGFNITYEPAVDGCGGIFHDSIKSIETPGYPQNYPNNAECLWEIHLAEGYTIQLKTNDRFHLEDSDGCTKDFLEAWDWVDDKWVSLGKKCGRDAPTFNSTTNKLKILFRSNNVTSFQGFKITWTTNCGGIFKADNIKRYLVSPGYPERYSDNLQCSYQILSENKFIYINFEDFLLEGGKICRQAQKFLYTHSFLGSSGCQYDNLTVVPNMLQFYGRSSSIYCGNNKPPNYRAFRSFSMVLKTDSSLSRRGFRLSYQVEQCGGVVTTEGEISSASPDLKYTNVWGTYPSSNMYCIWNITAPERKVIVLQ